MKRIWLLLLAYALIATSLWVGFVRAAVGDITLTDSLIPFHNPIGIDFLTNDTFTEQSLIISSNYPTGEPLNLETIDPATKLHTPFSALHGLDEELKIATVRPSLLCQTYPTGDVFTGTGVAGEIVRLHRDGTPYPAALVNPGAPLPGNPGMSSWVRLPGARPGDDLLRGGFFVDRGCAFTGDLIVVTGFGEHQGGQVWRVKPNGSTLGAGNIPNTPLATICEPGIPDAVPGTLQRHACTPSTPSASIQVHLEGVVTLPNDPRYGPWAGMILAGNENESTHQDRDGRIFAISPAGGVFQYSLAWNDLVPISDRGGTTILHHPMKPEDLDFIDPGDAFFGINFVPGRLLTAPASFFAPFAGDLLLTQEYPCGPHSAQTDVVPCPGTVSSTRTSGLYTIRFVGTGGNAVGGLFAVTPLKLTLDSAGQGSDFIDQWEHVTLSPVGNPRLTITKNPKDAIFHVGDPLPFTVVITNAGFGVAHQVTLTDDLPVEGGLLWAVTSITPSHPCHIDTFGHPEDQQELICSLGDLNPGDSVTIVVNITNAGGAPSASCTGEELQNDAYAQVQGATGSGSGNGLAVYAYGSYECIPSTPGVAIVKFTNNVDANDPNAAGVPTITPGQPVTWTYRVTNTGNTAVPRSQVLVSDNTPGVIPTFTSVVSGNADLVFQPGEIWLYTATGVALDLTLPPPAGVTTVAGVCTAGGTQPARTAYVNTGRAQIPGSAAQDASSYCNPPPIVVRAAVTLKKFTNGADADDPNNPDVPLLAPGALVTWTYVVENHGDSHVPRAQVIVTDTQAGVTPTFTSVVVGNADTILDPGETWRYTATGTAFNLALPAPTGVTTIANRCTAGGTRLPRTAYVNIGRVQIPNAQAVDASSYCNPPPSPVVNPCVLGYPFASSNPRTSTVFNENATLRAVGSGGPDGTVRAWYSDEHAGLLGIRTAGAPVSLLVGLLGHFFHPLVGDRTIADPFGRPYFPSLFITDITTDPNSRAGDWQFGGTPIQPDDIFGTWKAAVITGTKITVDADPKTGNTTMGAGSNPLPVGASSEKFLTEVRWNLSALPLTLGHQYRFQFIAHDGDQNKVGGDVGQACLNVDTADPRLIDVIVQ